MKSLFKKSQGECFFVMLEVSLNRAYAKITANCCIHIKIPKGSYAQINTVT